MSESVLSYIDTCDASFPSNEEAHNRRNCKCTFPLKVLEHDAAPPRTAGAAGHGPPLSSLRRLIAHVHDWHG